MENFDLDTIESVMIDAPEILPPSDIELNQMAKWYGHDEDEPVS